MKTKKKIIIVIFIFSILFILALIFRHIDSTRFLNDEEPKFAFKIVSSDGNRISYIGLGYKMIAHTAVSPKEPFKSHTYKKMGSWFMRDEMPKSDKILYNTAKENTDDVKKIENIDDFYNTKLTNDKDIRKLAKNYSVSDAKKDNVKFSDSDFDAATKFVNDFKNNKSSYIRVGETTTEGDLLLYDILYNAETKQLIVIIDNTRDEFQSEPEIFLRKYKNTEIIEENSKKEWVIYSGEKYNPLSSSYESLSLFVKE